MDDDNLDDFVEDEPDDDIEIANLLERAERSLRIKDDKKFYVSRDEAILLAKQPNLDRETSIEKDCGGNWVIEVFYSRITFIHATSYHVFVGQRVQ